MNRKKTFTMPAVGGSALLTVFAVLCLTVLALLSLSSALSSARLADAAVESTESYYAASLEAERVLARLRAGEMPECVSAENGLWSYSCPIDENSSLRVELRRDGADWEVVRWQSVAGLDWENDSSLPVWSGE